MESHYKLVCSGEAFDLEKKVNHLIDKGYIPCGSLLMDAEGFVQPMTIGIVPEINANLNNY